MRKFFFCLMAVTVFAVSAFATHRVDSIRVSVSSGSHTINTAPFPNGVWFQLPGGVRESSKTSPPFPTVGPGGVTTVTFNLISDPDTVIGANFDMSMDGVPHPGQNSFTGASWLAHLNVFGDLIGHDPNDADIRYQLVLKSSILTKISPPGPTVSGIENQSVEVKIKAAGPMGTSINASSDNPALISITPALTTTGADSTATFTVSFALSNTTTTANLTFTSGPDQLVVPAERTVHRVPTLTSLGLAILALLLTAAGIYYFRRRKALTA